MQKKREEQGVFDPFTGKNITDDFVSSGKEELGKNLETVFEKAEDLMHSKENPDSIKEKTSEEVKNSIYACFNSMKLPPDEHLLKEQQHKLNNLIKVYKELLQIGKTAEKFSLTFDISLKPVLSFHFGWECSEKGLFITFKKNGKLNSTLYSAPLSNMKTDTYGPFFVGGMSPAADLLRITKDALVFVCQENNPSSDFLEEIRTKDENSDAVPCALAIRRGPLLDVVLNDPACVDCPASPSKEEVIDIAFSLPDILAVGICTSGNPAKEIIIKSKF